jgi:hypothetical protein
MASIGPLAIEWLASGALVTVLGVLIKYVGWTWLLAGYSESTASVPDDVVRDVAGNTVLSVGVTVIAFGVLASVTNPPAYLGPLIGAVIVLAVVRLIYRLNTWSPSAG